MKRLALVLTASVLLSASLAAQTVPGFSMRDARSLGLGGTFLAVSEGYRGLYGNPSGFASRRPELTILAPASWAYVRPDADGVDRLMAAVKDDDDEALRSLLADNGFGSGFQLGIGYAGRGFGVGLFVTQDTFAARQDVDIAGLADVDAATSFQVNAVIGGALPVRFLGVKLTLGADLRPFFLAVGSMSLEDAVAAVASPSVFFSQTATGGFGLAVDLGVSLEMGAFTLGVSVRDIAPEFSVNSAALNDLLGSWSSASGAGTFRISPKVSAGVLFHPDLGSLAEFFDPLVVVEAQDIVSVIRKGESPLNMLHAGAEVKAFNFLVLRAGVSSGWLTAGVGLDLACLEINAAAFTEELGSKPGAGGRGGIVVEAAIRL